MFLEVAGFHQLQFMYHSLRGTLSRLTSHPQSGKTVHRIHMICSEGVVMKKESVNCFRILLGFFMFFFLEAY